MIACSRIGKIARWAMFMIGFIILHANAEAQVSETISKDYYGTPAAPLFNSLETDYGFQLFSTIDGLDSVKINVHSSGMTVSALLDTIARASGATLYIDPYKRIFIGKEAAALRRQLPADFFDRPNDRSYKISKAPDEQEAEPFATDTIRIGEPVTRSADGQVSLSGFIRKEESGAGLAAISINVDQGAATMLTDEFGYYSLELKPGPHILEITGAGLSRQIRTVLLQSSGRLDINMKNDIPSLRSVVVTSTRSREIRNLQMGVNRLSIANIRKLPTVLGEADPLKAILSLPGVSSAGEAANGFNVRGGATDQNLVLFGGGTIYNPVHLFGFFSAFNPDVVDGIALYKADLPERYAGRISSVLDVSVVEPDKKKWTGVAGIGPLTSKLTIQGPLKKDKSSLLLGARSTYSNWILRMLPDDRYRKSRAAFSDFNLALQHQLNDKNLLRVNGYYSRDNFSLASDTSYKYQNLSANLSWQHFVNSKLSAIFWIGHDRYDYSISHDANPVNAFDLSFAVQQEQARLDFHYRPGNRHQFRMGISSLLYRLQPGSYLPSGSSSIVVPKTVDLERGLENAIYIGDEFKVSGALSLAAGIRYTMYSYLGPHTVQQYQQGEPREEGTVTGSKEYGNGKTVQGYQAPTARFGLRYQLAPQTSLKMGISTAQQFIHKLSNTVSVSPTDTWKLSDSYIKPQQGWQGSVGIFQELGAGAEISLEAYYKRVRHYLDYKSGAELLVNQHVETDVFSTRLRAYGLEFQLRKNSAKWKGWVNYSFSRSFMQQDDSLAGELVNKGNHYPASFDRPHTVNLAMTYQFSLRYSVSVNFAYHSGRPITIPIAVFNNGSVTGLVYGERNQYRLPDYIRGDIAFNLEGNHNIRQRLHNSWSAGIYNVSGRQNIYSVYYTVEEGKVKGYQLSIFGTLIPFITYTLKF